MGEKFFNSFAFPFQNVSKGIQRVKVKLQPMHTFGQGVYLQFTCIFYFYLFIYLFTFNFWQ